jgi:hypothetical protein
VCFIHTGLNLIKIKNDVGSLRTTGAAHKARLTEQRRSGNDCKRLRSLFVTPLEDETRAQLRYLSDKPLET